MRPKWCPKGWRGESLFWRRKKGIYTSGVSEDSASLRARPVSSTGSMPGTCSSLQLGAFLSFLQRIFWNPSTSLKFCWINTVTISPSYPSAQMDLQIRLVHSIWAMTLFHAQEKPEAGLKHGPQLQYKPHATLAPGSWSLLYLYRQHWDDSVPF